MNSFFSVFCSSGRANTTLCHTMPSSVSKAQLTRGSPYLDVLSMVFVITDLCTPSLTKAATFFGKLITNAIVHLPYKKIKEIRYLSSRKRGKGKNMHKKQLLFLFTILTGSILS